ncbi:NAD-dependent deacetylase sirtuin-2, partial [Massariosphaeria phaeospora]
AFNIGRKHKAHRQQLQQSEPWLNSQKNRSKGRGRRGRMGQGESHVVSEDTPPQSLDSRTVEAVAQYIKDGRARRIVVMTGAGISTSAGIPDFRSPDTGLYANLARLKLPHAEAVFEISYFRNNPLPFYTLAQELYPGNYRPTITHSFITLLHQKGLLLKLFTQNIDCLEREAGVPDDMLVEAHGSFANQRCIECKSPYPKDLMRKAISEKSVPHCITEICDGLVKPDIVFFGEQLPADFNANKGLLFETDLCIILGTSLSVQPFASLPQFCPDEAPRVLINKDQVGGIGSRADDVLMLGDCDTGVRRLAEACGWLEELEALWAKTAPKDQPKFETVKKSPDEQLQDKVDQLTKDIDENLRLSQAQHKWLENHVDNKFARIQGDEKNDGTMHAATAEPTMDAMSTVVPVAKSERTGPSGSSGALGHVFPFEDKKPSL